MQTDVVQRWRDRRGVYRPARETFDPTRFEVGAIPDDATAKAFVIEHHYSRSFPAARRRFGLFERGAIVGVAVFSQPMQSAVLRPFAPEEAMELGRLVLLDHVLANAESWFVARAFDALRGEGVRGVVSFSDPEPREDANGRLTFPGHIGTVYQALNALYTGRARPNTLRLLPDGTNITARTLAKIRQRERGWRYAVDALVARGAEPPTTDDLRAWLQRALPTVTRKLRHGGNHRYVFGLTPSDRKWLAREVTAAPYPKINRNALSVPVLVGGAARGAGV
ncbi:MAG: hypothetical protein JNK72_24885 [Myxococcales bacterium]|nr:hypothetical protein [Myxococcales bacterium]